METELSKNLILLGVDPRRIIKQATAQGRVKVLKDLVGEGIIEDSWVDWALA